jgi:integral membrane protein
MTNGLRNSPIGKLRWIGRAEGVSFVLLVFLAVPLKYLMSEPLLVKVLGPVHGLLFMWLAMDTATLVVGRGWARSRGLTVFVASLLPFGPFLIESRLAKWQQEFDDSPAP